MSPLVSACDACGYTPPAHSLLCSNCGARRPSRVVLPSSQSFQAPPVPGHGITPPGTGLAGSLGAHSGAPVPPAPSVSPAGARRSAGQGQGVGGNERLANTADRVARTGSVMFLSGCVLALVFWVLIPLVVIVIALAVSSPEAAVVVGIVAFALGAFIWLVFRATGRS